MERNQKQCRCGSKLCYLRITRGFLALCVLASLAAGCGPDLEPAPKQLMHKHVGGDCDKTAAEAADGGRFCL